MTSTAKEKASDKTHLRQKSNKAHLPKTYWYYI